MSARRVVRTIFATVAMLVGLAGAGYIVAAFTFLTVALFLEHPLWAVGFWGLVVLLVGGVMLLVRVIDWAFEDDA